MHWKVEPGLDAVKVKVAERVLTVPVGPDVIVVSGGACVVKDHVLFSLRAGPLPPRVVTSAEIVAV